ncbi:hypothetical protein IKF30_02300 [Candidatus Saccharibacteria bacterium]|nr:hypothetical protein [Candidatus Saccharibacteria bacterium]
MDRKLFFGKLVLCLVAVMMVGLMLPPSVGAEGEQNTDDNASQEATDENTSQNKGGTSISLMPVSKVLQIAPNSEYEDVLTVNNDGDDEIEIEVFAAPYAYVYSEDEQTYKLGFNTETNFTQIVRWVTFKKADGGWDKKAQYKIPARESLAVKYKITTPNKIPEGGQYAVIFAHTLTGVVSASGIRTEASPGMVLFGRSAEGDIKTVAQISDMSAQYGIHGDDTQNNYFYGSAKVKNDGNIDFNANGKLKVEPIIGFGGYETPESRGRVSVIPESELEVTDRWDESPVFGLYKVTWTVKAGEETETIETLIFVNPIVAIIVIIIVLTIITIWTIMIVRKRKDRRSRLAV